MQLCDYQASVFSLGYNLKTSPKLAFKQDKKKKKSKFSSILTEQTVDFIKGVQSFDIALSPINMLDLYCPDVVGWLDLCLDGN